MNRKRVVVTGLGITSCFGSDVDAFYQSLLAGKSGVTHAPGSVTADYDFYTTLCAPVKQDYDLATYIDPKEANRIDPVMAYAVVAGKNALKNAGINYTQMSQSEKERAGILIGSGIGGLFIDDDAYRNLHSKTRITPFFIPYSMTNAAGAILGVNIGFKGPNYSVSTACATGNYAIHLAAEHIRRGDVDMMLAGGTEAPVTPPGFGGFCALRALSKRNDAPEKASRPWDKARDGFVIGDGAGVLVLEELESAKRRGATILAEYLGGAFTCDAFHMTNPDPEGKGVAACLKLALQDAGVDKKRVNYINAHATSTGAGDPCEIAGFRSFFGGQMENGIAVNGTKSMIGHALGGASGIEAVVVVKAIQTGMLHPTINLDDPDDFIKGIDTVPVARAFKPDVAISTSFGFGGHNSVAVFAPFVE